MPGRRFRSTLLDNPYERIDVGYFDRKALEKQQRHDAARVNYSKFAQEMASKEFLDSEARQAYMEQQNKYFEDVLKKHSGNLSSGYQDILGAVEKSKASPYHNLNKRQIEQSNIRQKLIGQYGSDAIDLSNINAPLMTRDSKGNIQWGDPNDIEAKVVKADDYAKIIENMLAETAAHKFSNQTGLGGGSGNPFYLMSRITSGEVLSPQELMNIASNPAVQQAFLANATTAGIDNRNVPGSSLTYKDMFSDPKQLAHFIYGNIQDKQRNNIIEKKEFRANTGARIGAEEASRKRTAKYAEDLKKQAVQVEPNVRVNLGIGTTNDKKWVQLGKEKKQIESNISSLDSENDNILQEMTRIVGKVPKNAFNQDGTVNVGAIKDAIKSNNPNLSDGEINQLYSNFDAGYTTYKRNKSNRYNLEQEQKYYDRIEEGVYTNVANPEYRKMYNSLDNEERAEIAKILKINPKLLTEKEFVKRKDEINRVFVGSAVRSKMSGKEFPYSFLTIGDDIGAAFGSTGSKIRVKLRETEKAIGDKIKDSDDIFKDLFVGIRNKDTKSAVYNFEKNFNNAYKDMSPVTALSGFVSATGTPLIQQDEFAKEIIEQAQDEGSGVKLNPTTFVFPSGDNVSDGSNTLYVMLNYTDANGVKHSYPMRAKNNQNSSVIREYENALLSDAYSGTFRSEEARYKAIGDAHTIKGKGLYGDQIIKAFDAVEKGFNQQTIKINAFTPDGRRVEVPMFVSKAVIDGKEMFKIKLPGIDEQIVRDKYRGINGAAEIAGKAFVEYNPKMAYNTTITTHPYYKPVYK